MPSQLGLKVDEIGKQAAASCKLFTTALTHSLCLHHFPALSIHRMPSQLGPKVDEIEKDNSQLVDRNQVNQALTAEDIEALKREGKVGGWGVSFGALCINSAAC